MIQLIYASRPFGFNEATLNGILNIARHYNERDEITGALICRDDLYLQLLEGRADVVEAAYRRIARETRHLDIRRSLVQPAGQRLFATWAMRDDPARSWMWSRAAVEAGELDKASVDDLLAVFARLAAEPAEPVFA